VAVLPFENLGDSSDAYFADGVSDAIRGKVTSLQGLAVIARSSSDQYRRSRKTPTQIGDELGVQYLLTGTVRWAKGGGGGSGGNRVQVSPELIQVATANAKWQQSFDASITDVFQVQKQIAEQVGSALDLALGTHEQQQLASKPTANLQAYDAFLKGEAASSLISGTPPELRRAIAFYEQAVALDSDFVLAWSKLSRARSYLYYKSTPSPALGEATRVAAERAAALAPASFEAAMALGDYETNVAADFTKAAAHYQTAAKLAPTSAEGLTAYAFAQENLNRWDLALEPLQRAQQVDPRSVDAARRLGSAYLRLRKYAESQEALERALQLAPTNLTVIEGLIMAELGRGDLVAARGALHRDGVAADSMALVTYLANYWDLYWVLDDAQQKLLLRSTPASFDGDSAVWSVVLMQVYHLRGDESDTHKMAEIGRRGCEAILRANPGDPQMRSFLGLANAYLGNKEEARRQLDSALVLAPISKDGYAGPYYVHIAARGMIQIGDQDRAIDLIQQFLSTPYHVSPAWLRIDPTFAPLKGNPRFQKIIEGS